MLVWLRPALELAALLRRRSRSVRRTRRVSVKGRVGDRVNGSGS